MKKWVLLGAAALALAWGPFLYAELTSEPVEKKKRDLPSELRDDDTPVRFFETEPEEEEKGEETAQAEGAEEATAEGAEAEQPAELAEGEPGTEPEVLAAPPPQEETDQEPGEEGDEGEAPEGAPPSPPPVTGPTAIFKAAFDSEPRDALWASATEQRIAGVFSGDEVPEGLYEKATCRKTVCQVAVQWSTDHAGEYAKLYLSLREQFGEEIGVEPSGEPGAEGAQQRLHLYLLREGYALEDLQQ